MLTLALDASISVGSVAVIDGARVLAERETAMRDARSERLLPAVAEVLAAAGVTTAGVDRIVCGEGPGSFTSLRIAASIAKGLAVAHETPLLAVSSLLLTVMGGDAPPAPGRYLSALDAMRGDSFAACYAVREEGDMEEIAPPAIGRTVELAGMAAELGARLIGPRMPIEGRPRARGVARLERWLAGAEPVDVGVWEPLYGRLAEAQVKWEAMHRRPLEAR